MNEKNSCGCSCDCSLTPDKAASCGPKADSGSLAGSHMDTQIFKLGLGLLPTSVYIIIAALQADGVTPDFTAISSRWNEKPQALEEALGELRELNIIVRHQGAREGEPIYLVNPASLWAPNNKD